MSVCVLLLWVAHFTERETEKTQTIAIIPLHSHPHSQSALPLLPHFALLSHMYVCVYVCLCVCVCVRLFSQRVEPFTKQKKTNKLEKGEARGGSQCKEQCVI